MLCPCTKLWQMQRSREQVSVPAHTLAHSRNLFSRPELSSCGCYGSLHHPQYHSHVPRGHHHSQHRHHHGLIFTFTYSKNRIKRNKSSTTDATTAAHRQLVAIKFDFKGSNAGSKLPKKCIKIGRNSSRILPSNLVSSEEVLNYPMQNFAEVLG